MRPPILAILRLLTTTKSIERTSSKTPIVAREMFLLDSKGEIKAVVAAPGVGVGEGEGVGVGFKEALGAAVAAAPSALARGIEGEPVRGAPKN